MRTDPFPYLGRWLSRDPLGEDGGINLYAYALNRPVKLLDPTGLTPQSRATLITLGATVGFLASLPVDALGDFFTGGGLAIANPAMTGFLTTEGAAAGAWIDTILNSEASGPSPSGGPSGFRGQDARRSSDRKIGEACRRLNKDPEFDDLTEDDIRDIIHEFKESEAGAGRGGSDELTIEQIIRLVRTGGL